MKLLIATLILISSLKVMTVSFSLSKCFDELHEFHIKPQPVSYFQIIGTYYGQSYCRVNIKEVHPYSCVKLTLHPQKNFIHGRFSLSILPKGENRTAVFHFNVYPTLIPGIFILAQDNSFKDARLMAVLDHGPHFLVYYLCSTTAEAPNRHYNDFRMNTVPQHVNYNVIVNELSKYQTSPRCNYFIIPQMNCPN
ncbi:hypothetical protein CHUAL_012528 [Chamberlinius hualienensis]